MTDEAVPATSAAKLDETRVFRIAVVAALLAVAASMALVAFSISRSADGIQSAIGYVETSSAGSADLTGIERELEALNETVAKMERKQPDGRSRIEQLIAP